ncbi:DNA-processing protein DprA [Corynebacterium cystitidis]|uniref:DNA-processing protein DprA n=1 Tax=Corynebacterium cystitidis TaxID=35757 RepID=UPI00211E8B17|nr:DNA-processing protein DprA [Corynebacterium cystitidis]
MTSLTTWAYLKTVVDGPSQNLQRLLRASHSPEEIAEGIKNREGWIGPLFDETASRYRASAHQILEEADRVGFELVTPDDPRWPQTEFTTAFQAAARDATINQKTSEGELTLPHGLWVRGSANLKQLLARSVAIVGTRTMTEYGKAVTRAVAEDVAAHQYTIISGGALGVDTQAHTVALEGGARTMVVMAGGPGYVYPQQNTDLFERIVDAGGTLVTEYYPRTSVQRYRFLERNRLVAAMAQGTVVTQAGYRSGALNTLTRAQQFARVAMAVPGPINDPSCAGCNVRIRNHEVIPIADVREVHASVTKLGAEDVDAQLELEFAATPVQELSRNELRVFDAMPAPGGAHYTAEEIANRANLSVALTVHLLVDLAKRGLAVREGSTWVRV